MQYNRNSEKNKVTSILLGYCYCVYFASGDIVNYEISVHNNILSKIIADMWQEKQESQMIDEDHVL